MMSCSCGKFLQCRERIIPTSLAEFRCKRACLLSFAPCPPPGLSCNDFLGVCRAQNLTSTETDIVMTKCGYDCQRDLQNSTTMTPATLTSAALNLTLTTGQNVTLNTVTNRTLSSTVRTSPDASTESAVPIQLIVIFCLLAFLALLPLLKTVQETIRRKKKQKSDCFQIAATVHFQENQMSTQNILETSDSVSDDCMSNNDFDGDSLDQTDINVNIFQTKL